MPLIIDNNRRSDFTRSPKNAAIAIFRSLEKRQIRIAVCKALLKELTEDSRFFDILEEWARQGSLVRADEEKYEAEYKIIENMNITSDDEHILALARCCGSRLLYTEDRALIDDFKCSQIISPRGKVITKGTREGDAAGLLRSFGF